MSARKRTDRQLIPDVVAFLELAPVEENWSGVDPVLPILERMRADGAIVVFKLDGERGPNDNGAYTGIASGHPLGEDYIRVDAHTLEDALAHIIVRYATKVWGYPHSE